MVIAFLHFHVKFCSAGCHSLSSHSLLKSNCLIGFGAECIACSDLTSVARFSLLSFLLIAQLLLTQFWVGYRVFCAEWLMDLPF